MFLSHSHQDRAMATDLQKTLVTAGADVYLDQDNIQAGDDLPKRIVEGLTWCETVLLIWSAAAASSVWVSREWNTAYDLRKRILPYVLDKTPLPTELDNLVYVDLKDRELGDSNLLKAIFGKEYAPDPTKLFPGVWYATVNMNGMAAQGEYVLELRPNGQLIGESKIAQNSQVTQLLSLAGMSALSDMQVPISGNWSYDRNTQSLNLQIVVSVYGQQTVEKVIVHTNGRENQAISGSDFQGRIWRLWRST
jgi:hypothetical protein